MKTALKKWIGKFLCDVLLLGSSAVIIVPILIMVFGSFKTPVEAQQFNLAFPGKWILENYVFVFNSGGILKAMKNSLILTSASVCLCVALSSFCAFIIARRQTATSRSIYSFFLFGLIAPIQFITTFALLKVLKMIGTYFGVIMVFTAITLPLSVFIFTGFIKGIPKEMDEAAVVDGCGPFKTFVLVVFPLLKPVIATNVVIIAMSVWNDFTIPLYFLNSSEKWTMPLTVYNFFGQYSSNWNYVFADLVLTALPIVLLYLYAQRYIISGMTAGAVKG